MSSIWSKFDQQSEECYTNIISSQPSIEPWLRGFELFQEIVTNQQKPGKKMTLDELDEMTDWDHDFSGWLEDFLDELDMREKYEELSDAVDYLLCAFDWSEGDDFDLKFYKAESLWSIGKEPEAYELCKKWLDDERGNSNAVAAMIYACMHMQKYDEADRLAADFIGEGNECNDFNYVVYVAAQSLYAQMQDTEKAQELKDEIEKYDEIIDREIEEGNFEDSGIFDDEDFDDEDDEDFYDEDDEDFYDEDDEDFYDEDDEDYDNVNDTDKYDDYLPFK